jgi:hypothetical protein
MTYLGRAAVLIAVMMAAMAMFGQTVKVGEDGPTDGTFTQDPYVDYGDGGGGGRCFVGCYTDETGKAGCGSWASVTPVSGSTALGYSNCRAYNTVGSQMGPGYCVLSGYGGCSYSVPPHPWGVRNVETEHTLAALLGDDGMALFMDEVSMRTLGMTPDARVAEEARLYAAKLKEVQLVKLGVPEDQHVMIPRPRVQQ